MEYTFNFNTPIETGSFNTQPSFLPQTDVPMPDVVSDSYLPTAMEIDSINGVDIATYNQLQQISAMRANAAQAESDAVAVDQLAASLQGLRLSASQQTDTSNGTSVSLNVVLLSQKLASRRRARVQSEKARSKQVCSPCKAKIDNDTTACETCKAPIVKLTGKPGKSPSSHQGTDPACSEAVVVLVVDGKSLIANEVTVKETVTRLSERHVVL